MDSFVSENSSVSSGVDVTADNFMEEVITASQTQPVVVDFWAEWCEPCKQLMPMLEAAIAKTNGAVKLAKLNIDAEGNNAIAAQLRVQSVPTVYAFFNGQPVDGFTGAQPQSAIDDFVKKLEALNGGEQKSAQDLLEEADTAIGAKDYDLAMQIYQEVLSQKPDETQALAGMVRCLIGKGEVEVAKEMLEAMTPEIQESEAIKAVKNMLATAEKASEFAGQREAFEERIAKNPNDPEAHYELGLALYGSGDHVAAMEALLQSMRVDIGWNDDAARLQLLEIFEVLGQSAPEVIAARRQLSSLLFA